MPPSLWLLLVAVTMVAMGLPPVPSPSPTVTPTLSLSATQSPTETLSATSTRTPSATRSPVSASRTSTPVSKSKTPSRTVSPSSTPTATPSRFSSPSTSLTRTPTSDSSSPSVSSFPDGHWCPRQACIPYSCDSASSCCGGVCVRQSTLTTVPAGGTCGSGSPCSLCQEDLYCDSPKCTYYGSAYGCSCTADYQSATGNCLLGRCTYESLSVGASCNGNTAFCATGVPCTNNVCTAVPIGTACVYGSNTYDPSSASAAPGRNLDGGCVRGAYCPSSGAVCTARLADGAACTRHRECASGLCNVLFCAAAASVPSQGACSDDYACQSGLFCDGVACQPKVGQWARCTQSKYYPYTPVSSLNQKWCQSGLICSLYDGERPICMPGNVAPGGVCYNTDQCSSVSSFGCLQSAPGVAGVCSGSSAGRLCIPGNSTWCGTGSCSSCTVLDGSGPGQIICGGAPPTGPTCDATAAQAAAYAAGYGSADFPYNVLAVSNDANVLTPALTYVCCLLCNGLTKSYTSLAVRIGRSFDCRTSPPSIGAAWSGLVQTGLCGDSQHKVTEPITFAQLAGGCPSPTPTISLSKSPAGNSGPGGGTPGVGEIDAASETHGGLSKQLFIVAIAVPVAVGAALVALAIFLVCYCRRRKKKVCEQRPQDSELNGDSPTLQHTTTSVLAEENTREMIELSVGDQP